MSKATARKSAEPLNRRVTLRDPAPLWLERLRVERGYADKTLASYRQALLLLCDFAADRPFESIREADIRQWVAMMARRQLSARSIAQRLSVWRGFFEFVGEQRTARTGGKRSDSPDGYANPARGVRAPRVPKRLPKALSPDMAHQLAEYEPGDSFEDIRDKAMLELFYSCGLRLSEMCALDATYVDEPGYRSTSWLDMREAQVTVKGKGSKSRVVPVGRVALAALTTWLQQLDTWRTAHPGAEARALFVGTRGARVSPRTVQARLKQIALKRGVPANVHPHVLRHSFASHLLQSSGDLRAVQELLGHASIATTQVYTALDFQRLAKVYDDAHPRARKTR